MLMSTLKLSLSAHYSLAPSSWEFMAAHECSWAIMSSHEYQSALMSTHKQPRAAMSAYDCSRALMTSHEHSWAWRHGAMGTHESLRVDMSMASWDLGPSLALLLPRHHTHESSWALISTHEPSWALMIANENSWVLACSIRHRHVTKNVNFLNDPPVVFCQYLSSDLTKWQKLDIFKIYTKRAAKKCPRMNF